jgi:hypothetical protein
MIINMKICILLLLVFTCFITQANTFKVVKLKGMALISKGGDLSPLKMGDKVKVGEVLLTGQKSFIRLSSTEGQVVTLGPVGKLILGVTKNEDYSVLNLLKGQLRAKVKKNGKSFYVNSKTASVGVRGTDFLVIHNDINKVTSTLAFSGKVEVFKKSDKRILDAIRSKDNNDVDAIEEDFSNDDTKFITKGQFTGAFPGSEFATSATKISPKQAALLAQNDKLEQAFVKDILDVKPVANREALSEQLAPAPAESEDSELLPEESEKLLPGGLLDLDTGIYVEPPKGSKFNNKTKVYELPKKFGTIDKKTGRYLAPEGLELHPLKGFILKVKNNIKKSVKKLKFLRDRLNRKIEGKVSRFKDITQLDINASADFFYNTNVMEEYYGERRNITSAEAAGWLLKGSLGHNTFNNKRYIWYPKLFGEMQLHNRRDDANVKRNDYAKWGTGLEFHRKHKLFDNKASFIVDVLYQGDYRDHRNKNQFDFYTEDSSIRLKEVFKLHRKHKTQLSVFSRFYQGHEKTTHGKILGASFNHQVDLGKRFAVDYFYEYSKRSKKEDLELHLSKLSFKAKNILRKTDMLFGMKGLSADKAALDFWGGAIEVRRKKGPFMIWSGKYEMEKVGKHNQHIFSGGLKITI